MDSSPRPARLAVLAALIAAFAAMPGDAHALRFTPEQIDAITEHTRRGAPVEAQCGQTCAALRQTELTANTRTTPAWRRVIGQANNLRARAGLIGRVPLHASATVAAAAGAAYVGFKLGEGVNAKFFRFGIFGDDNVRPNVAQYTLQHYAANAGIPTDTDPAYISVDYPSWQLSYRFTTDSATHRRRAFYRSHNPPTAECDSSPNIDYTHLVWQGTDNCQVGYRQWKPYGIEWGVHLIPSFGHRSGPHPDGPIEDYTGQPVQIYVPDPDDPGPQATRDSVVEQLEQNASSYPDLVEWYEFHLGVPGSRDPITGRVRVPGYADSPGQPYAEYAAELERLGLEPVRVEADEPDFDFEEEAVLEVDPGVGVVVEPSAEVRITANPGGWLGKRHPDCERNEAPPGDPAPERDIPPGATAPAPKDPVSIGRRYEIRRYTPPLSLLELDESFQRNTGSGFETVYMRWGWTYRDADFDWEGWGYRHIAAKHSWEDEDRQQTVEALLLPEDPAESTPEAKQHYGPQYLGRNGTPCRRAVVVAVLRRPREITYGRPAKHLITSYPEALP
jgi:hypothetical protein